MSDAEAGLTIILMPAEKQPLQLPAVAPQPGDRGAAARRPQTRPVDEADLSLAADRLAIEITAFVAGPLVDKGWSDAEWQARSPATRLRRRVWEHIEQQRHRVFLGEHRGVTEITEKNIPHRASTALSELYVTERCEAIVIIPDSPGSFCELGAWAVRRALCRKMLILVNANYMEDESYINKGVLKSARHNGATIAWVHYNDPDSALKEVSTFLDLVIDDIIAERIQRG